MSQLADAPFTAIAFTAGSANTTFSLDDIQLNITSKPLPISISKSTITAIPDTIIADGSSNFHC